MKVLTPEERTALIHRPFLITYLGTSYPWGGTQVYDRFFASHEEGSIDPQDGYLIYKGQRRYLAGSAIGPLSGFQIINGRPDEG